MLSPVGPGARGSIPALVMRTGLIRPMSPTEARRDLDTQHILDMTARATNTAAATSCRRHVTPNPGAPLADHLRGRGHRGRHAADADPERADGRHAADAVRAAPLAPAASAARDGQARSRSYHPHANIHGSEEPLLGADAEGRPIAKFRIAASPPHTTAQSSAHNLRLAARALFASGLHALAAPARGWTSRRADARRGRGAAFSERGRREGDTVTRNKEPSQQPHEGENDGQATLPFRRQQEHRTLPEDEAHAHPLGRASPSSSASVVPPRHPKPQPTTQGRKPNQWHDIGFVGSAMGAGTPAIAGPLIGGGATQLGIMLAHLHAKKNPAALRHAGVHGAIVGGLVGGAARDDATSTARRASGARDGRHHDHPSHSGGLHGPRPPRGDRGHARPRDHHARRSTSRSPEPRSRSSSFSTPAPASRARSGRTWRRRWDLGPEPSGDMPVEIMGSGLRLELPLRAVVPRRAGALTPRRSPPVSFSPRKCTSMSRPRRG